MTVGRWGCRPWAALVAVLAATAVAHGAAPVDEADARPTPTERAAARIDYLLHCSGCHRPDGAGAPPEVPSLLGPIGGIVATEEGRAYMASVPEVAQAPLGDGRLARLLNWVLWEFSTDTLPGGFRPLDAREVGVARQRVLADPLAARAAIVGRYGETVAEGY